MKNFLLGVLAAAVVATGVVFFFQHSAKAPTQDPTGLIGASSGNEHYNTEYFYNGLGYKLTNSSTTPTVALKGGFAGHITLAAGSTTEVATTTAITANSIVRLQLEQSTPVAGTTCNTAVNASSTAAVLVSASSTAPQLNTFTVTVASAPVTNPFCFAYIISN